MRLFGTFSWLLAAAVLATCLMPGCAKKGLNDEDAVIAWPPPPQTPVIEYVETIRDSSYSQPTGSLKRFLVGLGGGKVENTRFKKPYGVGVDSQGRVFVSDEGHGKIAVFDVDEKSFSWMGGGAGGGGLVSPTALSVDSRDHIFVTDPKQLRVVEYGPDLKFIRGYGEADFFKRPGGMAFDESTGELWVLDVADSVIHVFDSEGNAIRVVGALGGEEGEFFRPTNIAIRGDRVYVSDTLNFRVQVLDLEGNPLNSWGGNCNYRGCFQRAKGIGVDSEGNVYVVDAAFNNVQIFDPEGELLLAFGGGGTSPGQLWLPAGLAIDQDDNIWVVSQYSYQVTRYRFVGAPEDGPAVEE